MIQVCLTSNNKCSQKSYQVQVKGEEMTFCCEKGFKKSIDDFLQFCKENING